MKRKSLLTLIATAALTALLFTSPVEARGQRHHGHYKHQKKHHKVRAHRTHRAALQAFVVPARIHHRHRADYRYFRAGDLYFRPHRHYHAIYAFPVRTRNGVVYREFEYCRGDRFVRNHISYHGRNVSFSIGF